MLLFYMFNEDDLLKGEKPFKIGDYLLPGVLDLAGQLEFLRTVMPNPDLIYYGEFPPEFESPLLPSSILNEYSNAAAKFRVLMTLMETAESENLYDSINQAVDTYRSMYPADYQGLEVTFLDGRLIVSIYNQDNLSLQAIIEKSDKAWQVTKSMIHFKLYEYNFEIRDNLQGNEVVIIYPQNDNLGIIPHVRDYSAIASIRIPNDEVEWYINIFNVIELRDDKDTVLYDYFTIAPDKKRVIDIHEGNSVYEQIIIYPSDYGISIQKIEKAKQVLPDGQIETLSRYLKVVEAEIDINALKVRALISRNQNLESRVSLVKKQGSELPKSTRVEYFKRKGIKSLDVRFRDDMSISSILVDEKLYLDGEFDLFLSTEGYYIFVLGDNSRRIPVSFSTDYTIAVPEEKIGPVFDVVDNNMILPFSNASGLIRVVSLN